MRGMLLALVAGCAMAADGAPPLVHGYNPMADRTAVVEAGNTRVTVLTPRLLRIEWSPDKQFEDRATYAVVNRHLLVPKYEVNRDGKRLEIMTEALKFQFDDTDSAPSAKNMRITGQWGDRQINWNPELESRGNLGGTVRTLDSVSGATRLPPGLLSREGWTLLEGMTPWVFGEGDPAWAVKRENTDGLDWYFFLYGDDYPQALRDYVAIGGRIPLPPRYAFGAWWSRYWPYSDKGFQTLVGEFREHNVPLDVLVIDMDWHLDGWTGYTWNPEYFPDPVGFLEWTAQENLRVPLNLHPADGVGKHEEAFAAFCQAMGKDPNTTEKIDFDVTDPKYMAAYFEHLHHPLEQQGVDFWWIDWQQGSESKISGLDPLSWLNYLHWADWERDPGAKDPRPLLLSRWGGLGNHRYQVGFSGDTHSVWESLAFQPYFTATAGNVGFDYWSHDIGGHFPGLIDGEIYVRWIQSGILSPILRTHTTRNPDAERRIWKFDTPYFEAAKQAWHLRYELLPYLYTMARRTYDEALPLCRPLYYHWPKHAEAYEFTNTFMFGDDLLAAPATAARSALTGCADMQMWIPPGTWINWYTGQAVTGPRVLEVSTPLDEIPLFARAGAIIPAHPVARNTVEQERDKLILHVWPGADGEAILYEDDGLSQAYRDGGFAKTLIKQIRKADQVTIKISAAEGSYDELPETRSVEVRFHNSLPVLEIDADSVPLPSEITSSSESEMADAKIKGRVVTYDPMTLTAVVKILWVPTGSDSEVTVRFHQHEKLSALIADGLRSQLSAIVEAADAADQAAPFDQVVPLMNALSDNPALEDAAKLIAALGQRWIEIASAMDKLEHLPEIKRRELITRWTRLAFHLQLNLEEDPAVDIGLSVQPPFGGSSPEALDWSLKTEGLKTAGEAQLASLSEWDNTWTVKQPLVAKQLPQTTRVSGVFTLKSAGQALTLPLDRVLLPSISNWIVAGPFDYALIPSLTNKFRQMGKPDLSYKFDLGWLKEQASWQYISRVVTPATDLGSEFVVDLNTVFGGQFNRAVAFAWTTIDVPEYTYAALSIGSDDGITIWINNQEVHRNVVGRAYRSGEDECLIKLEPGRNTLMLRIGNRYGGWMFGMRLLDRDGNDLVTATIGE
jgi:hypothetical protein